MRAAGDGVSGSAPGEGGRARGDALVLGAIVLLALALRLANAWFQSLHLDDFHTLHHARAASLADFLASLRRDNHPPLFFLVVRLVRGVLGESELAMRMPAVLFGVATVPLTWRIARRLPRGARATAALLVACSSLNLELSADLRMYSLLPLALAGFLDGVLDVLEEGTGRARCVLWALVGLHTHYHFVHALAVVVGACVVLALLRPDARRGLWRLAPALGVTALLSLPWYLWGFRAQLGHGLAPGGSTVSPLRLAEGMVHMVFINLRLGGGVPRLAFLAGGAIVVGFAGLAALRLALPRERAAPGWSGRFVLAACAFALPAWSALAAALVARAGFEWRYIAGAATPLAVLAADFAWRPGPLALARRWAAGFAVAAALALCVLNVRDPGREDNREAVRRIVTEARPGDAVVAAEWQPRIFPHSGAWRFYSTRMLPAGRELPPLIDHTDDFSFPQGTDFSSYERVWVLARVIPNHMPFLKRLRAEFPRETAEPYGMSLWLLLFERDTESHTLREFRAR